MGDVEAPVYETQCILRPGLLGRGSKVCGIQYKNVVSPLEGFSFNADAVATEVAQRNQIYGDANKLLAVGLAGDAKTAIEQLKSDSEAAGLQKILDEYQRQIDEFLASK